MEKIIGTVPGKCRKKREKARLTLNNNPEISWHMKKSRRTYNGVHLNKKSNTQDVVEQSLTILHTVRPCRNALVNSRFSYRLNLLVGKCFFSQSRKYRNEGTCIRQDTHSNTARHGGVCSSCHRRCISRFGMSARKRLPVSCIQPSGFFGQIR